MGVLLVRTYNKYCCCFSGVLSSTYGIETAAFLATRSELENIDWPDLQVHFGGFLFNEIHNKQRGFSNQVLVFVDYIYFSLH